ncbi:QsdR family transcriptional regulator [Nocardia sp. NPDC050697]|uniref:QsdR family transcriptional regulator n=1 Tax=Nocardia sp. NPDC050697 TaxID=3155158 RepID=UPI0033FBF470
MTASPTGPGPDGAARRRRSTAVRPTDDALLDGAVTVFAVAGFDRATMDELAAAAETTKPTLYAHFGGKDRLFEECVRREAEALRRWMLDSYARAAGRGIRGHTEVTTRALFDYADRHGPGFRLLFGSAAGPLARRVSEEVTQPVVALVAALIRAEHGEPRWGPSADFCAAVVADIAVRGVIQALEQELDFTAAAELTISMIVAALRHLDGGAARAVDGTAAPRPARASLPVAGEPYPELVVTDPAVLGEVVGRATTVGTVLAAAVRTFRADARFDVGAVAVATGVGRTTLYRRFGSREGLLGAALALEFELLVGRVDRDRTDRGAVRVSEVLHRATRALVADAALRRFVEAEESSALRLITRADKPVHTGSVAVIEALLERARRYDRYEPPIESAVLAYALARLGEAFLYNDVVAGVRGDVTHLRQVQRALLGIAP